MGKGSVNLLQFNFWKDVHLALVETRYHEVKGNFYTCLQVLQKDGVRREDKKMPLKIKQNK